MTDTKDPCPRLLPDGTIATDVDVNPKFLERVEREKEFREKTESEGKEPWSRAKVERYLTQVSTRGNFATSSGKTVAGGPTFHGVDLSGLDLSGLDLSRANLHGAKLTGTNLSGCRLVSANLHEADLSGADLSNVNAVEANFHGACLCRANVGKTHFMKANLSECCHESATGLDVEEKPLTPAEEKMAAYRQSEGFRPIVLIDSGVVRYFGSTLKDANVAGMSNVHKKRH